MNLKKLLYTSLTAIVLLTGCTDSTKKEKPPEQAVKKAPVKQMSVSEKKQNFKDTLIPIATTVYNELEEQYLAIKLDIKNNRNKEVIEKLKKEYNAKTDKLLLNALKPHPISILLAQAAAESAWLTSRFTKEANNIFGVWSFNKNEPRIAASGLRGDKTIYLKKYKNLKDAVKDYYKNLGKTWAYAEFRKQRMLTSNPYVLSDYLTSYSEKKGEYTKLLRSMIKYNKFEKYDVKSDIKYTQYIVKKPKVVKVVQSTVIEVKDTNQTKVEIKVDLKSKIKVIEEKATESIIETKDINTTQLVEKLQSDS